MVGIQQDPDWFARHGDGWLTYPRGIAVPRPIHLGLRSGAHPLRAHLKSLQDIGVNHVALNLRFNQADTETTINRLADEVLPDFSH